MGGYNSTEKHNNELFCFDLSTSRWQKIECKGKIPSKRSYHTLSLVYDVSGRPKLYLFGGYQRSGKQVQRYNDVHCFDVESKKWTLCLTAGAQISQRSGHTASVIGHSIYIFGGSIRVQEGKPSIRYLNDLHVLDTDTLTWKEIHLGPRLEYGRRFHSASVYKNTEILFFGGHIKKDSAYKHFNDICIMGVGQLQNDLANMFDDECSGTTTSSSNSCRQLNQQRQQQLPSNTSTSTATSLTTTDINSSSSSNSSTTPDRLYASNATKKQRLVPSPTAAMAAAGHLAFSSISRTTSSSSSGSNSRASSNNGSRKHQQ
eukprot:GEZU01017500.1.p1 GENE.GEZU01017500.1~~GEZU01017500.1.p1  ORF type:complete len:316 (+),score=36.49 GEZU01017500.1:114-1061(+)